MACFLTRGDLWVHWERGAEVFEELLLDADWALNAGNWQWLSSTRFFHQYWRVYSPVAFGKKTDPSGAYIRKYLPALRKMPDKYIYAPWEAPPDVQRAAGCVIGRDYPAPIVDHAAVSKENIARFKAFHAGRKGADGDAAAAADEGDDDEGAARPARRGAAAAGGAQPAGKRKKSG